MSEETEEEKRRQEELKAAQTKRDEERKRQEEFERKMKEKMGKSLSNGNDVVDPNNISDFQKRLDEWKKRIEEMNQKHQPIAQKKGLPVTERPGSKQNISTANSLSDITVDTRPGKIDMSGFDAKKFAALKEKIEILNVPQANPSSLLQSNYKVPQNTKNSRRKDNAAIDDISTNIHRSKKPSMPALFNPDDVDIKKLFEMIETHPETQSQQALDKVENAKWNASILSRNATFCAKKSKPLVNANSNSIQEDDRRVVFNIIPNQEGPIYMPRKTNTGETVKDNNGQIVYDILFYDNTANGFKLNKEKSFISPDNIPKGSFSSVVKETREELLKHHGQKFEATKNRNIEPVTDLPEGAALEGASRLASEIKAPGNSFSDMLKNQKQNLRPKSKRTGMHNS